MWTGTSRWNNILTLLNEKKEDVEKSIIDRTFSGWVKQSDINCLRNGLIDILSDYGFTGLSDALHCAGYDYDSWKTWNHNWIAERSLKEIEDILNLMKVDSIDVTSLFISGQYGWRFHSIYTPYGKKEIPASPEIKSTIVPKQYVVDDEWYDEPKIPVYWIGAWQSYNSGCSHYQWSPTTCLWLYWRVWDSGIEGYRYYKCHEWQQTWDYEWSNITIKSIGELLGTEKYNILSIKVIDPTGTNVANYFTISLLRNGGAINFGWGAGQAWFASVPEDKKWNIIIKIAYHTCIGE